MKINRRLLPIKAHYFFFFAALGPLLPQMSVFGRQLGASATVMGFVTAVLPLLWALAKPVFGYIVDYFPSQRKLIFMLLITSMTTSYCGLWFLPFPSIQSPLLEQQVYQLNKTIYLQILPNETNRDSFLEKLKCHWNCYNGTEFEFWISNSTYVSSIYVDSKDISCSLYHMDPDREGEEESICAAKPDCHLFCFQEDLNIEVKNKTKKVQRDIAASTIKVNSVEKEEKRLNKSEIELLLESEENISENKVYSATAFWIFVVLMCIGTVAFNVANCIGDAVCFDVLGTDEAHKYGSQRAWGTVGYGATALVGGWLVDLCSPVEYKDFTPAFILAVLFTGIDLFSASKLKLPSLSSPEDSGKALYEVLKIPRVLVFIIFAIIVGTFDSLIIYYMFWFLEELAESTGHSGNIKLIEGVVVAAECLIGEVLFFFLSGKIINRWGFGRTMSFSLFCYAVKLALISVITNPWQLVVVEGALQGPTYALCYSCIVGYAAKVAPEGYSATVQGLVAGVDDGLGFAIGSLLGGVIYSTLGARSSFRIMATAAAAAAAAHAVLFKWFGDGDEEKNPPKLHVQAEENEKMLQHQQEALAVYRETVEPIQDTNQKPDV